MLVTPSSFHESVAFLADCRTLVVDTETQGLDPWHGARLAGIAIMGKGRRFYFPFRHVERDGGGPWNIPLSLIPALRPLLSNPNTLYIGYNYKFDMLFMHQDGIPLPQRVQDVMLAAHLINENEPDPKNPRRPLHKLKYLATKYVDPLAADAEARLEEKLKAAKLGKGDMWKLPPEDVVEYAEDDVLLTAKLGAFYAPALKRWHLWDLWEDVNRYELTITRMEIAGMPVDTDAIRAAFPVAKEKADAIRARFKAEYGVENPRSIPQLTRALNMASTNVEAIDALMYGHPDDPRIPALKLLREFREWDGVISRNYEPYLEYADCNRCIHCNLNMIGTISSRLSCSNPNLQAVPVKASSEAMKMVKKLFIEPDPDYLFVNADYSQAELRFLGHRTRDERMRDLFASGADFHGETAKDFGLVRDHAKRVNFGIVYGLGAKGLSAAAHLPMGEAKVILSKYHKGRPGIRTLMHELEEQAQTRGYIRLWTGRMRHFNTPFADPHKAMSNDIQGGVAEIMRVAIQRLDRAFAGTDVVMRHQVHDSIIFKVPRARKDEVLSEVKDIMENGFDFFIPPKVDIQHGNSWGDLQTWEREQ